jgi:hypothetical protein
MGGRGVVGRESCAKFVALKSGSLMKVHGVSRLVPGTRKGPVLIEYATAVLTSVYE